MVEGDPDDEVHEDERNGDKPRDGHRRPQEQPHDPVDERLAPGALFLGGQVVGHGWAINAVPKYGYNEAARIKQRLEAQGHLAEAESLSGFRRILNISPDWPSVLAFVITLGLVLVFSAGRLRFAPHVPVMQSADARQRSYSRRGRGPRRHHPTLGGVLLEPQMAAVLVVVGEV